VTPRPAGRTTPRALWRSNAAGHAPGRGRVRTRTALVASAVAALSAGIVGGLSAQSPKSGASRSARGEAVWLIVRPRVGDTLHLQMEQTIEIRGRKGDATSRQAPPMIPGTRSGASPKGPDYGPRRERVNTRITKLQLFAHSHVESSDLTATTLLATTDSMSMWAGNAGDGGKPQRMPLPPDGRQVRVRVTPDGAMRVNDPPPGAMELGATLASMPGMLPDRAVAVGDKWERDIFLPSVAVSGFRADGVVRARFRLDSLTHAGRDAWISMEGTLERDGAAREMPAGTRMITAGTVKGVLLVDRQRAWIIDARTTMDVQSEVASGPAGPATPMLLDMRILQRIRVR
jgi:hypothetical protein